MGEFEARTVYPLSHYDCGAFGTRMIAKAAEWEQVRWEKFCDMRKRHHEHNKGTAFIKYV